MVYIGPLDIDQINREIILKDLCDFLKKFGINAHIQENNFSLKTFFLEALDLPRFDSRIFCIINYGGNKGPDVGITTQKSNILMVGRERTKRVPLCNPKYKMVIYESLMNDPWLE